MNHDACEGCEAPLKGRRKDAKWCSEACRVQTYRERQPAMPTPLEAFYAGLGARQPTTRAMAADTLRPRTEHVQRTVGGGV